MTGTSTTYLSYKFRAANNKYSVCAPIEGTWSSVNFRNFRWNNETVLHFR
jgi:hypothetical protein